MTMGRGDHHLFSVDLIRAVAIIMVVVLHVAAPVVVRFQELQLSTWWIANLFDAFVRPGVPLFVMISGLLLLDPHKQEPVGLFLRKRFSRILVPFVIWAFIYMVWRTIYHGEEISFIAGLQELLSGPVFVHFWFLYMIMGLYLAAPILQIAVRNGSKPLLWYIVILWFAVMSILPTVNKFLGWSVGIDWVLATQFVGYFLLGSMLRGMPLTLMHKVACILGICTLSLFTAWGSHLLTVSAGGIFDSFFYDYLSPNVIITSVLWFLLLQSISQYWADKPISKLISAVAGCSFTIYLSHLILVELLQGDALGFSLHGLTLNPAIGIHTTSLFILCLLVPTIMVIRKLPFTVFSVRQIFFVNK
jgi:surface polysaccharide O-acyltransferase-like enzyme